MEIQETTRGNYSFTLTIPSKKKVYYQSKYVIFSKLSHLLQYDFLENHLQHINRFTSIKWVYEEHTEKDKRLHVHGYVLNTVEEEIKDFIDRFYKYPIILSYKTYHRLCDYQKTIIDLDYWKEYCEKNQKNIKYYMRVDENKKHELALDGKESKFKVLIETNLDAHYFNALEQNQESLEVGHKYPFGKNNKFLVEF